MAGFGEAPVTRRARFLLVQCVGLVVLMDWLFFEQPIGWTAGLMVGVLALLEWLGCGRRRFEKVSVLITVALLGLAVALSHHGSLVAAGLSALGLLTLSMMARGRVIRGLMDGVMAWCLAACLVAFAWAMDLSIVSKWVNIRTKRGAQAC